MTLNPLQLLNKQALSLFNKENIEEAINLWKKATRLAGIPGLGYTANAEALNNLGFAYYKLALQTHSDEHFKLANYYLNAAEQVDPQRWIVF